MATEARSAMTVEQAKAKLAEVGDAMATQFGGKHPDRLNQLTAALATADMAVEHLFDEEMRRADNEKRREERIRAQVEAGG